MSDRAQERTPQSLIRDYHVHLYYDGNTLDEAREIAEVLKRSHEIKVGTFHQRPIGPHPVWSCQLTVSREQFGDVVSWLSLNRGRVDIFVHPNTGYDLLDHTQHVMWLGESYPLNLSIFR